MADEQLNVGIGLNVKGAADAKAAFAALKQAAQETGSEFQQAATRAKALADAVTAAQALSGPDIGIKASAPGLVSDAGLGAVTVSAEEQAQAQSIINALRLDALAVTRQQTAILREEAAAAAQATAATDALGSATSAEAAAGAEAATVDTEVAASEEEIAAAATTAAAAVRTLLAPLLQLFRAFEQAAQAERQAAAALREESAQATAAAAAQERLAAQTAESTAAAFQAAGADQDLAASEREVGAAATTAAAGTAAFLAPLLELFAAFEAFRGFKDFVDTGVGFNATIESARIGIAAVTSSLGTLTDAQGRALQGEQAFQGGLAIADDQIAKLQVDALRTATTMSDLVTRFQSTEGAGLRAGATLDQIRQIVVGASQAAGALNVPYTQLNSTLVQLLNGHIRVTNRLTADLGLTTAQVRQWKESGTLVEHLVELFGRFDVIGEHVQGTWRGILSNIRQAFQIFTGDATRGLFDTLEQGVNQALHNVFNFKTGGITSKFTGLAEGLRTGLGAGAQLVVDLIQKMVDGARELSHWFETHQEETAAIARNAVDLVENIGKIVLAAGEIAVKIALWVTDSGLVQATFRALADLAQLIASHIGLIVSLLALRVVANLATDVSLAAIATGSLGGALLALVNPVTLTVAAIAALVIGFEALRNHQDEVLRQQEQARQATISSATQVATLAGEYRQLATAIESGTLTTEEKRKAQQRLKDVTDQLIAISPDYKGAIEAETGSLKLQTQVINDLAAAREHDLAQKAADAQSQVSDLTAQGATLQGQLQDAIAERNRSLGRNFEAAQGTVARLSSEIDRNKDALDRAKVAAEQLHQAVLAFRRDATNPTPSSGLPNVTGRGGDEGGDAKDKSKEIESARIESIKAIAEAQKKYLDDALRENELSYAQYFARLNAIELTSIDVQIAAKKKLLFGTETPAVGAQPLASVDPGQRAQLLADLGKLEQQKTEIVQTNAEKRQQLEDTLDKKVNEAAVQYLEDTGHAVTAFALKFDDEYRALYARLDAEGDAAGKQLIDNLFQAGLAKAQAEELKQTVDRALQGPAQQVREIQQLVKTHAIDEERGRDLVVAAYQRELAIITEALEKARQLAAAQAQQPSGVAPQTTAEIDDLQQKAERVRDALAEVALSAQRVKVELAQGVSQDIVHFLDDVADRSKKGQQAFNEFAQSVIESIQRVIAQLLQSKIQQALLGLLGAGAGAGAAAAGDAGLSAFAGTAANFAAGFASGGVVRGPGGPTEDRIPAMLSAGEYVVPAHAVAAHGSSFFDAIVESARMPLPRHFAAGGLVAVGPVGGHATSGRGAIDIGLRLDKGLILETMSSPEGHKVHVETAAKNPGALRQALRLPSQP